MQKLGLWALTCTVAGIMGLSIPAQACTLWAAAGSDFVKDGGVLIAKNRDYHPDRQEFKIEHPKDGFAYMGIFTGKTHILTVMGVNSEGLVVIRSMANGVDQEKRLSYKPKLIDGQRIDNWLLTHCATVADVLKNTDVFYEPVHYLVADKTQVAVIEVLPGGKTVVRTEKNGTIAHTNHYCEPDSRSMNDAVGKSSKVRLRRIHELLDTAVKPMTMDDFIRMSIDRHNGANNSIWRDGNKPDGYQTLANMTVHLPPTGNPMLQLTYRTQKDDPTSLKTMKIKLTQDVFAQRTQELLKNFH